MVELILIALWSSVGFAWCLYLEARGGMPARGFARLLFITLGGPAVWIVIAWFRLELYFRRFLC